MLKIYFFIFLFSPFCLSQIYEDTNYQSYQREKSDYFFHRDQIKEVEKIIPVYENLLEIYEKEFNLKLDQKFLFQLVSLNNQSFGAYVQIIPHRKTLLFPSSIPSYKMNAYEWMPIVLAHELSHIYQLSTQSEISKKMGLLFGNVLFTPLPFPIFIYPNLTLPNFILEGSAVLNESRLFKQGRLYSGKFRSLFLNILKARTLQKRSIFHEHFLFPHNEKYVLGAYFFLFLSEKFGLQKTQSFFKSFSENWLLPFFQIHSHFKEVFLISFDELWNEFEKKWSQRLVKDIKALKEISSSFISYPLNHSKDQIFYLTSNGSSDPKLNIFHKKTNQLEKRDFSSLSGKVFLINSKFYTQSSFQNNRKKRSFGLYDKNYKALFLETYTYDLRNNKKAYSYLKDSILEALLYVDDQKIGKIHGSALLDELGNVYYFKQKNGKRSLFKNKKKLFSYKGSYGNLLEVYKQAIYFTANTKNGSSIFKWKKGIFYQVHPSNNLIDARMIDDKRMLATEITPFSYKQKVLSISEKRKKPTAYSYSFKKIPLKKKEKVKINQKDLKKYSSLKNLRFSKASLSLESLRKSLQLSFKNHFSDPLSHNKLQLSYKYYYPYSEKIKKFSFQKLHAYYQNTKHFLNWNMMMDAHFFKEKKLNSFSYKTNLNYIFFKNSLMSFSSQFGGQIQKSNIYENSMDYGTYLSFIYDYQKKSYFKNYYPYRYFNTHLKLSYFKHTNYHLLLETDFIYTFPYQTYLLLQSSVKKTLKDQIPFYIDIPFYQDSILKKNTLLWNQVLNSKIKIGKVFNPQIFHENIPLSLSRLTPFMEFEAWHLSSKTLNQIHYESSLGLEIESLLSYKQAFRVFFKVMKNPKDTSLSFGFYVPEY